MTAPTLEQKMASDPHASAWVAASAGTGKTFVLTNRVLRILLSGVSPERILCLTFTKAAAEMANRLTKRLGEWVSCPRDDLRQEIQSLTGHMPSPEQEKEARKLFARVLDVPGGLKIQTIHAFCQSLLGRFPLEAGIAPHFQVMDDRTTFEHLARARDAVLSEAQKSVNPALARALARISSRVTENTFAELIRELIGQRSGLERMMRRFLTVERAGLAMGRGLGLKASDTQDGIITEACACENFDGEGLRLAVKALLQGSAANQATAAKLAHWLSNPEERAQNFDDYKSIFMTQKATVKAKLMTKGPAEAYPEALLAMTQEAERLLQTEEKLKLSLLLDNSTALLALGAAMMAAFGKSKKRHGMMDYDDLILKVTGLIGQPGIADWILYKLDGGIDHILIDEAQDTNPEQWQVIKTLANEFFVGESRAAQNRTIFAVGDVKQSIYSFQRADPKEFVENRRIFETKALAVAHDFHYVNLDLSFRSTGAVLKVVDRTFEAQASQMALSFSHEEVIHRPSRSREAGLVELWPTMKAQEVSEPDNWQPPVIQEPSKSPEMKLAIMIADRIGHWLSSGEVLISKGRPMLPEDIMILVRRRTVFDDYMIRALKARGIPVAGQDKMKLAEQIAVRDLMAVGHFVLLPSDDLTLAVVLKSPFIGFSEDDLYDLAYGRTGSLWARLLSRKSERPLFQQAHDLLIALTNLADTAPPFEFYSNLLIGLEGRKKLTARLGEEANDPIDEFLQLALSYEMNNISSLQGFLSWVDRGNMDIKRDMEQGQPQVRIMTIHGAKGLQAPVVILPDTCQIPKKSSRLLWAKPPGTEDQLLFWPGDKSFELGPLAPARDALNLTRDQEYLRLLYVAMTRAEDRLYITGWEGKDKRPETCWYDMIQKAMTGISDVTEAPPDRADYLLRLTCPQDKKIEPAEPRDVAMAKNASLPLWAEALPPTEAAPIRPLRPSRPAEEDPAVSSPLRAGQRKRQDKRRYNRGRLIHRLLEILPDMPVHKRRAAAEEFLSQPAYGLEADDIDQITHQIIGLLTDEVFSEVFGPNSRAEVSIVGVVGETPISGQVDRLVISDHEILIIDYKTNRPPPKRPQDVPPLYLRQMAAYRAVLSDIYPDKPIRCLLLWTDISLLMALPGESLDQITFSK